MGADDNERRLARFRRILPSPVIPVFPRRSLQNLRSRLVTRKNRPDRARGCLVRALISGRGEIFFAARGHRECHAPLSLCARDFLRRFDSKKCPRPIPSVALTMPVGVGLDQATRHSMVAWRYHCWTISPRPGKRVDLDPGLINLDSLVFYFCACCQTFHLGGIFLSGRCFSAVPGRIAQSQSWWGIRANHCADGPKLLYRQQPSSHGHLFTASIRTRGSSVRKN